MVNSVTVKEFLSDVESAKAALFPILQAGAVSGTCCFLLYGINAAKMGPWLPLVFALAQGDVELSVALE